VDRHHSNKVDLVETILKLNEELYARFMEAKQNASPHMADVLLGLIPYLKMYITFISGYNKATKLVSAKQQNNSEFRTILQNARDHPRSMEGSGSEPLCLPDLMPKPLQRIFAYNNMLQRMAELVPKESRVYGNVLKVKEEMEKTVRWVNEEKKKIEVALEIAEQHKKRSKSLLGRLGVVSKINNKNGDQPFKVL
jgi:hypothetical protein